MAAGYLMGGLFVLFNDRVLHDSPLSSLMSLLIASGILLWLDYRKWKRDH